ncbi:LLM class flavin-dependent oxidoreductase [Rhodococcus sp. DMU1]|uniref:LLM class flavin-dependent oxidoreductase n=1 Tax=Rhodococcus sp. DMU1 TaxID=2722825 RepID=UPI00143E45DC|nr:LLM class flavin-dependent oxidoreductase [Rhodococcus sp. DMU1]QIX53631.1 LLM class flavin-dependent oxidoreductase [Rhodococcus sp. DMU1]
MSRTDPLLFNIFIMNTPSHISPGMWRHPESRAIEYNSLDLWVEMAKIAERGKLDGIFIADIFGLYGEFRGSWDVIAERAVQFPVSDPSVLISAMAHATEDVGFVYTSSILQAHPFSFARAASTLDHLTKGRIGWNVVTSVSKNGSRSMGLPTIVDHDERYRWAEEYTEVTYKLWEGSWEDEAVVKDRDTGLFSDPRKIHKINHVGERYSVEGPHLVEPSPQRTPVLFQAGASSAGMAFAAKHAEGVFMISGPPQASAAKIEKVKALAAQAGRRPDDIRFIEGLTFIVGSTEEEARRKEAEYDEWNDLEAQMAVMSGTIGVDLSTSDPDEPLEELIQQVPGMRGVIQLVIDTVPDRPATVADLLAFSAKQWRVTGTPESIADKLEEYRAAGVDGINIMSMLVPGTYTDFVDHVAPELQQRGLMKRDYQPGTLREKLFPGRGPRLEEHHVAAKWRNLG